MLKIALIILAILIVLGCECVESLKNGVSFGRIIYIVALVFLSGYSVVQAVDENKNLRFVTVDRNGTIEKQKNFDYKVVKSADKNAVIFVMEEFYVNARDVEIKTDPKELQVEVYNAMDGVGIKFLPQIFERLKKFSIRYK